MRAVSLIFKKALLIVALLITSLFAVLSAITFSSASNLPDISDVKKIVHGQTTRIYSGDGTELTSIYSEDRTIIPLSKVSNNLIDAVVAVEDRRFFEHPGVDLISILRATIRDVRSQKIKEGGSTITQQYIKNAYFSPEKTLNRKISEAILAVKLEKNFNKQQILEKYLNTIYFGHGAYGIESASRKFFRKKAKDLNMEESATLAGMIKNPTRYSPVNRPREALKRRNYVLGLMVKQKLISQKKGAGAKKKPINIKRTVEKTKAPYFVEHVRLELLKTYDEELLLRGGLKIYTTLNWKMQQAAEKAAASYLKKRKDPSVALVSVDPNLGAILAMVGGKDFSSQKFNLATQAKRQPGSAFKPFVLAAALSRGVSPDRVFDASSPKNFEVGGKKWEVSNYEGETSGSATLRVATHSSINTVYSQLIMELGAGKVAQMARNAGISSVVSSNPAIALGGLENGVSPMELVSAYSTFAAGGFHYQNFAIDRVENSEGRLIFQNRPVRQKVITDEVAYLVNDVLKGVISSGTGRAAKLDVTAAGKTGTTQNYSDAWFVGYTPKLATSVWVGYPEAQVPMENIDGIKVTGGSFPAKIWAAFMSEAILGTPDIEFANDAKSKLTSAYVCAEPSMQNFLATKNCPDKVNEVFIKGHQPSVECPEHRPPAKRSKNKPKKSSIGKNFNKLIISTQSNEKVTSGLGYKP